MRLRVWIYNSFPISHLHVLIGNNFCCCFQKRSCLILSPFPFFSLLSTLIWSVKVHVLELICAIMSILKTITFQYYIFGPFIPRNLVDLPYVLVYLFFFLTKSDTLIVECIGLVCCLIPYINILFLLWRPLLLVLLAYFPYFYKIEMSLRNRHVVCESPLPLTL